MNLSLFSYLDFARNLLYYTPIKSMLILFAIRYPLYAKTKEAIYG